MSGIACTPISTARAEGCRRFSLRKTGGDGARTTRSGEHISVYQGRFLSCVRPARRWRRRGVVSTFPTEAWLTRQGRWSLMLLPRSTGAIPNVTGLAVSHARHSRSCASILKDSVASVRGRGVDVGVKRDFPGSAGCQVRREGFCLEIEVPLQGRTHSQARLSF